jgi:serine/threonine-protein kinase BUR1
MFSRVPILGGESDRDQLYRIVTRCGPLNDASFPGWKDLPGFPNEKGHPWDQIPTEKHMWDLSKDWQ